MTADQNQIPVAQLITGSASRRTYLWVQEGMYAIEIRVVRPGLSKPVIATLTTSADELVQFAREIIDVYGEEGRDGTHH